MILRNKTAQTLAIAALGTLAASVALTVHADPDSRPQRGPIVINDVQIKMDERFNEIDANNDETLSLDEFLAAAPEEARTGMKRKHGGRKGHRGKGAEGADNFDREAFEAEVFAAMDADGNGELSASEASRDSRRSATKLVMRNKYFARLDENADGVVDRTEFSARVLRLAAADADADGTVTKAELKLARSNARNS